MSRNGSGTYTLPAGNPVVSGTVITTTWANTTLSDIATALTASIAKDGQTIPTANLPMGTYKHTGVAVASALTDYARADQVQNSALQYLTSVSGADTITANAVITPAAYSAGQAFRFVSVGANTGAATLNVSGLGAKDIKKQGTNILAAGDIPSGAIVEVVYDGTNFQLTTIRFQEYNADTLFADEADNLTAGFTATSYSAGTKSSGTFTPDTANGNFQHYTNGGAHTLAPPSGSCTMVIQITNNASAGAITTSGFTKVTGTAPVTTDGYDFFAFITVANGFSYLAWQALQ